MAKEKHKEYYYRKLKIKRNKSNEILTRMSLYKLQKYKLIESKLMNPLAIHYQTALTDRHTREFRFFTH